ncbi:MAG: efflux RND transporter periplasmic adaptor subunit [Saprospiraceae bacterium]|nr:efflux RND transporter periplasmic adaptor subunit [Saprospiraceae bacterium]
MKIYLYILFVLVQLFACQGKREFIVVEAADISESVYSSGKIKSRDQYQVMPKLGGILSGVLVEEGQMVKKGDLLFTISNEQLVLQKESALLASKRSALDNNIEKIEELKNSIEQAALKKNNDSIALDRQKALWLQNIGSKQELDLRELAYKSSRAAWRAGIERMRDLQKSLDYQEQQAKTNFNISQASLADFSIKAEKDGKVYRIFREIGELVGPNVPLAVIGSASEFIALMNVDERDASKIKLGQKAYIELESFPNEIYEAKVSKISPYLNERDKTFEVEAMFDRLPTLLYPNQSFEANILVQAKTQVITIPRKYLSVENEVFIGENEIKQVKLGLEDLEKVEITEGLNIGDKIYLPK